MDIDENEHDEIINTNVKGPLFLSKYVINQMLAQKIAGTIINVSSINSYMVGEKIGDYGATKATLSYNTKVLAYELASSNIRVNSLDLGLVPTNMNAHQRATQPGLWQNRIESNPLKQAASAILYFASSKSGNTTGASLAIAGGTNIPIEDRFITTNQEPVDKEGSSFMRAKL